MHVVLLSGGTSSRLWPLSSSKNNKQFAKLFKNNNNEYESLLQRNYNLINNNCSKARIIIAATSDHVPYIREQITDEIKISEEPCIRDTFPAILLSCCYIKDVLHAKTDDPIIVSPVDTYADGSFFGVFNQIENHVLANDANLWLCGISPSNNTESFGYILPETGSNVSSVKKFIEKPNKNLAQKIINKGALWNSGVFGFSLKYIIDKGHEIIDFKNYHDLKERYKELPKISFDYAICEKEENIKVIKYEGDWDDLGSWDRLTNRIEGSTLGNVQIYGEVHNSTVINLTNSPIYINNIEDVLVVTTSEGMLISKKRKGSKYRF